MCMRQTTPLRGRVGAEHIGAEGDAVGLDAPVRSRAAREDAVAMRNADGSCRLKSATASHPVPSHNEVTSCNPELVFHTRNPVRPSSRGEDCG